SHRAAPSTRGPNARGRRCGPHGGLSTACPVASRPPVPQVQGFPGPMSDNAPAGGGALSPALARLLLVAVVVLWGVNWPVMKLGVAALPPVWFAPARMVLGAASLFLLLAWLGRVKLPTRRDLPVVLSVGALQMGAFLALV